MGEQKENLSNREDHHNDLYSFHPFIIKQDGFALMIQLGRVLGGGVGNIPITLIIQLAKAGSKENNVTHTNNIRMHGYTQSHPKSS